MHGVPERVLLRHLLAESGGSRSEAEGRLTQQSLDPNSYDSVARILLRDDPRFHLATGEPAGGL